MLPVVFKDTGRQLMRVAMMVIGGFFGWAMVRAMLGTMVFSLPYSTLIGVVVLATLAGVLAAGRPARRAAKLDVLSAVASE